MYKYFNFFIKYKLYFINNIFNRYSIDIINKNHLK